MARKQTAKETDDEKQAREGVESVRYWLAEIKAAQKREKHWREDAERSIEIAEGEKSETTPFNILHSNRETLVPALYSATPRPIVTRRYKDDDPLGRAVAMAATRGLEFMVDTNLEGYETFSDSMRAATLAECLAGRGITCVKYDYDEGERPLASDALPDAEPETYKKTELVCTETKVWNRVLFGYARSWHKMPWIAFEEHLDREECERLFGEKMAANLTFTAGEETEEDEKEKKERDKPDEIGEKKTTLVYQIYDKDGGRKIKYLAPCYKDQLCKVSDDTLGLTGFFPIPRPLQFIERVSNLVPVAPYILYENQAKELNRIQIRINRCVEAMKARGAYDSGLGPLLEKIMEEDDNKLVPADATTLSVDKGFHNAIWFMPLAELAAVLERLYQARESCKQTIYEIMGIADIMRGASKASETLGAQKIKTQWGTLRIKPKQSEVQRYSRDLLRMMLEVAANQFSESTWAKMTGLPYTTQEQRMQLEKLAAAAKMSQQPLDPQAQAALAQPTWKQVLDALKNDTQRAYKIDIETNSTLEPEAAEDQKNIAEMLTGLGTSIQGMGPLVEKGVMPFSALKNILLAIARRYRFGTEIEDDLKAMQQPQPNNAESQKIAAQQQADQARLQMEQQAKQADMQFQQQAEAAKDQRERAAEANRVQLERERVANEHALEMERIAAQKAADLAKLQAERQTAREKMQLEKETALEVARIEAAASIEVARFQAQAQAMVRKESGTAA